eukprot:1138257-Pelagomonas_calceolata.AAC.2
MQINIQKSSKCPGSHLESAPEEEQSIFEGQAKCQSWSILQRGFTIVWDLLGLYLKNVWMVPNPSLSVLRRHYKDQVLTLMVQNHPCVPEISPNQDQVFSRKPPGEYFWRKRNTIGKCKLGARFWPRITQ